MEANCVMAEPTTTRDIVTKLWNLCHILRDDGVTYNEYVTELTYLLFLKMMAETGREDVLPDGYRWAELTKRTGMEQLDYYKRLLLDCKRSSFPITLSMPEKLAMRCEQALQVFDAKRCKRLASSGEA
jgi:hypothetical protein